MIRLGTLAILVLVSQSVSAQQLKWSSSKKTKPGITEFGIGTEYGGIGIQYLLPSTNKSNAQVYVSAGLLTLIDADETDNNFYLSGGGIKFKIDRNSQWGLYGGAMGKKNNHESQRDELLYGLSVNYKVNLFRSDVYLGISYNAHKEEHFPMLSLSYRY